MSWYESPNRPCAGLYVDVDRRSRGYGEQHVEDELRDLGVRYVVLPTRGKPNAVRRKIEQRRAFKRTVHGEPVARGGSIARNATHRLTDNDTSRRAPENSTRHQPLQMSNRAGLDDDGVTNSVPGAGGSSLRDRGMRQRSASAASV